VSAAGASASAPAAAPPGARTGGAGAAWPLAVALAAGALLLTVAVRLTGAGAGADAQAFVLVFASIAVEALPFVLLGALVSAAIEVFVPERALHRIAALPVRLQVPGAIAGSLAFPVCECGSVPVARRLIARGMHPSAGLAFMLAAPVVNPVVLLSTAVAYQGRDAAAMVAGRAGLGLLCAVVVAWAVGGGRGGDVLRARAVAGVARGHSHAGEGRLRAFAGHVGADLVFMGRFVVLGAGIAALLQVLVPQSLVSGVLLSPLVGSLVLMVLAVMLSLCSEADAFVAVSFTQFTPGAQLSFLTLGPVIDAKLALLYAASFGWAFVGRLTLVAVPVILSGALTFEVLVR